MLNINCTKCYKRQLTFVCLEKNKKWDSMKKALHLRIQFSQLFPQSDRREKKYCVCRVSNPG